MNKDNVASVGIEEEDAAPILQMDLPDLEFFLPIYLADESSHAPEIKNYGKVIVFPASLSPAAALCRSSSRRTLPLRLDVPRNEGQFLRKALTSEVHNWILQQKQTSDKMLAIATLLDKRQEASGTFSEDMDTAYTEAGVFSLLHELDVHEHYTENGLFVEDEPILSRLFLEGEAVEPTIREICGSGDVLLSRATQRVLRELVRNMDDIAVRTKWKEELERHKNSKAPGHALKSIPEMNESRDDKAPPALHEATGVDQPTASTNGIPAEAFLIRHLGNCPMMRVVESPVDSWSAQPSIPPASIAYGGQLGQWSSHSTASDRLGGLPPSWEKGAKKNIRVVFRLHIHQLVFTEYHMMPEEERLAQDLKGRFIRYRNLLEQKMPEYFMFRASALMDEFAREVSTAMAAPLEDLDTYTLQQLLTDVLETLPAMSEFSESLKALTLSIYHTWTEIRKVRLRQSAVLTPLKVTVRKVRSNLLVSEVTEGIERSCSLFYFT